ncbi:MAG: DNA repair protein RecN, partial [bacterium]
DSFGHLEQELAEYGAVYAKYAAARKRLSELEMDESEKARRMDMLSYQIAELNRAKLTPGEYDEKLARRTFLKNAGRLSQAVEEADAALSGGDRADGALNLIENALESINHAVRYAESFVPLQEKLKELKFACQDAAMELRDKADELAFSPAELDELDERLDTLKRVLRKYGGTEEEALRYLEQSERELKSIETADEEREDLEKKLVRLQADAEKAAQKLTEARRKAGETLAKRIEAELAALSMKGSRFAVEITDRGSLEKTGRDEVRFLLSANAGESMGRIVKVASGGELSRVMLAMKSALAEHDPIDAMVFDEIDTGVSGIAAQRVAEKLAGIAKTRQVLCVTHLPQLAAMADRHFLIRKTIAEGRTHTLIEDLNPAGRARELARLTGGENITELTLRAAEEQLKAAERWKKA